MKGQREKGIHNVPHRKVMAAIDEFHVEIFRRFASAAPRLMSYACEI
jgi:hypothetical protein